MNSELLDEVHGEYEQKKQAELTLQDVLKKTQELTDSQASIYIFNYLGIITENKTTIELIDEVDNRLKLNLKQYFEIHGNDADLKKFASSTETILIKALLTHLTQVYRWSEE